jgi:hypothetical protein
MTFDTPILALIKRMADFPLLLTQRLSEHYN